MKVAQAILGHKSALMTELYTHTHDEQLDRAADALDALLAVTG